MSPGDEHQVPFVVHMRMAVPVHLPAHRDPDLGEPRLHVHIDLRFLDLARYRRHLLLNSLASGDIFSMIALSLAPDDLLLRRLFFQVILVGDAQNVESRSFVCQRQMPCYPHGEARWLAPGSQFGDPYQGHRPRNNRCPHKGLTLVREADGRLRCPGHGLCFAPGAHGAELVVQGGGAIDAQGLEGPGADGEG